MEQILAFTLPTALAGRYRVLEQLGRGGMSTVYRAHDRLLAVDVALKLVRRTVRGDPARLAAEFALLTSLHHPGVMRVHDVGVATPGEGLYLTAEYIRGTRLDHYLRDADGDVVVRIVRDLLQTLSWLHGAGVVHGDIKPQNVLIEERRHGAWPILIDFGLAVDAADGRLIGGTPGYLAPELVAGGRPTAASDLYALGVALSRARSDAPGVASLIAALTRDAASARPASADAALAMLGAPPARRRVGRRLPEALWGDAASLTRLVDTVAKGRGGHLIRLSSTDDATAFLELLRARLELVGERAWHLPMASGGDGLSPWLRLAAALGVTIDAEIAAIAADHREALDTIASRIIEALRGVQAPTLMVGYPAPEDAAGAYLLARLIEADVAPRIVLAAGREVPQRLARGADRLLVEHVLAKPDAAAVERFLVAHGVEPPLPPGVASLLVSRAVAGSAALSTLLSLWADEDVLVATEAGRWRFAADKDPLASDAPDLDAQFARLWARCDRTARRCALALDALGGEAPLDTLRVALMEEPRPALITLADLGWVSRSPEQDRFVLEGVIARRLRDGRLTREVSGDPKVAHRRHLQALQRLGARGTTNNLEAQARHLDALDRPSAESWRRAARARAANAMPLQAGRDFLCAAHAWARQGRDEEAFGDGERGIRWLEAGGGRGDALDDALAFCRRAAERLGSTESMIRTWLLASFVQLSRGAYGEALESAARAASLRSDWTDIPAQALELALLRGTALGQTGRLDDAVVALERAAELAERVADRHGLGRVTNNLGILHFNRGDYGGAADAWRRSAAVKSQLGDARGERVSLSNLGLALRELGRLEQAAEASLDALAAAERIADRRGQANCLLAVAQLWLDLGAVDRMASTLAAYEGLPVTSAVVSADAAMLRVRLAISRGRAADACRLAAEIATGARDDQLDVVFREAWGLTYLAWVRAGLGPGDDPSADQLLGDRIDETALALAEAAGGDSLLLMACALHAAARAGRWGLARTGLQRIVSDLGEVVAPGEVAMLDLLLRSARALGERELRERLQALAGRTVADRFRAARALLGEDAPEPIALTRALGLPEASARFLQNNLGVDAPATTKEVGVSTDGPKPDERQRLSATQRTTLDTLEAVTPPGLADPARWARALAAVSGAEACQVLAGDQDELQVVITEGDVDDDRFLEVARGVARGLGPFEAHVGQGQGLEALGLPLRVGDTAIGSVFLSFAPERPGAAALSKQLEPAVACTALALGHARTSQRAGELQQALDQALARQRRLEQAHRDEVTALRDALEESRSELMLRYDYDAIVHRSRETRQVLRMLDRVTDTDISVLLLGESGVGKELLARALHFNGPRRAGRFVAENCGAIPSEIFESLLFGHVKGAFTGAQATRKGLIEAAHGGTLFLDEVGELPLEHQVKLLRVLQERKFRPVGGQRELPADFRLVAATNRDLTRMVAEGTFREDLYYRMAVVPIHVPPLRQRRDDILPLAHHFLKRQEARSGHLHRLSAAAADLLVAYDWPGNVRQLDNEMVRAVVLCEGDTIKPEHLSARVAGRATPGSHPDGRTGIVWADGDPTLEAIIAQVERRVITEALEKSGGKKASVARELGLSRPGLDSKIARLGIDAKAIKARARQARTRSSP